MVAVIGAVPELARCSCAPSPGATDAKAASPNGVAAANHATSLVPAEVVPAEVVPVEVVPVDVVPVDGPGDSTPATVDARTAAITGTVVSTITE